MEFVQYHDAQLFHDAVMPLLLRREAENNLMISIIIRLADGTGHWGDEPPLLCAIEQDGHPVAAAVQTPPHHLILMDSTPQVTTILAECLQDKGVMLPGVLGPVSAVETFIQAWAANTELFMSQRIYQLNQVTAPTSVTGHAAEASLDEFELLVDWTRTFADEARGVQSDIPAVVRRLIEERRLLVWHDPLPVSMAASCGPTPHGIRVSNVYTPPACRGLGYATANVAALSQRLLDAGHQFCYLFTDLDNPVSNSIYQKIGYHPVCDFASYTFHRSC